MKTSATTPPVSEASHSRRRGADWPALAGGAVLAAAAAAAYGRTLSVPFLFDDETSVAGNPTLRHLGSALWPPVDATVGGRPVLNLSLALNYSISGASAWSYHAANLAIHVLASLALFGIVRRTLALRRPNGAAAVGFCAALLWSLHPLLTESVTYVIQRAESLMGLFYLLTLYCFIRGAGSGPRGRRGWYALCVCACALGMGTKEVMVSAPLVVLLYDRTFLCGGLREAWGRRRWLHSSLGATWLVLACLVLSTQGRAATVGFGSGVSAWQYACTQAPAIVHYLRLCVWPRPLIFDYGMVLALPSPWVLASALLIAALAAATAWALLRRPAAGFLGFFFFAVLAPSSSFIPVVTETVAEQRMYLALIPVAVLGVVALHRWLSRAALPLSLILAAGLGWGTWERNGDYRSAESIWADTVAKVPGNERAQYNLGCVIQGEPGRLDEAVADFEKAILIAPDYYRAHCNLGIALQSLGRTPEAIAQYEEALRLKPDLVEAHNGIGNALLAAGRMPEAIAHYQQAIVLKPDYVEAHNDLGCALAKVKGREGEAVAQFGEALRLEPGFMAAHFNLANTLNAMGRAEDAVAEFEAALRLKPDDPAIHFYLAGALLKIPGRTDEAVAQLKEVERLQPDNDVPRQILARINALPP